MKHLARKAFWALGSGVAVLLTACAAGSVGNGSGGEGGTLAIAPTVSVAPSANSISIAESLQVTVTVAGASGSAKPTGSITLSSGTYSSSPGILSSGITTITLAAAKLAVGSNTLTATYAPDAAASTAFKTNTGTVLVAVTVATPAVTVTPAATTTGTNQALSVIVTVAGFSGGAIPAGAVTLTSGNYNSGPQTLREAGASISILGGSLTAGSAKLTASYSPDTASSSLYASGSGSATVTVTPETTPTVSLSPGSQSLNTSQSLIVTVKVKDPIGSGTPTGSVVLSNGSYQSSPTTLSSGSASVGVPAYSLAFGSNTLTAAYTADSQSSGAYNSATGSAVVSVARATPMVTVTPAQTSIDTSQTLSVTVSVAGPGTSAPAATGSVRLTSGSYSTTATLASGGAAITIPEGALPAGSSILSASYTPDSTSSPFLNSASGTSAAVTVVIFSTVLVNQSTTLAPVTEQLMGMNLAAWYDDVANAGAINAAFGKAGIKAIRWPGGSWSDAWHWRTSLANLLPYMCNTKGTGTSWGGYSSFSDFVNSIAKGGSYDLALTANYGSNAACNSGGDPAEAAAWAAEALGEGYPASHMTIGNENYGSWEYDLHPQQWDAGTYANSVIGASGYYQLIKAASPTTMVGVVVDAGAIQANWDSTVLSAAKGSYDFVEYHYYPQNPKATGVPGENDSFLVHTAAQGLTTYINRLKSELATAGVGNIPIYVGEMGSVSANPGKQSWSITQGLYAGQALGEMMNAGVSRATWWIGFGNCNGNLGTMDSSLYGWQSFGAYNVFSDGPGDTGPNGSPCAGAGPIGTMSPTAQAFNLFKNIAVTGESALSTTVAGDLTNIRAYAATHSGGTALFLFNLNPNQSQPLQITLSAGSGTANDVTVITYNKELYDQTNAATPVWADPKTTDMGAQNLPLTLTLTPWSMNVVIIK